MEREISYTEWWSRHDCKLLCNAGLDPYPGTERTRQTFFSKIRQKLNAAAFLIAKELNVKPKEKYKRQTYKKRIKKSHGI